MITKNEILCAILEIRSKATRKDRASNLKTYLMSDLEGIDRDAKKLYDSVATHIDILEDKLKKISTQVKLLPEDRSWSYNDAINNIRNQIKDTL